jgi:5-methylcytosine-specific restriction endonuclease McrA
MEQRVKVRMPTIAEKKALHERDGYNCRFCGAPVIRMEVRRRIQKAYPDALPWGRSNLLQHAAFQAMWAQYDHVIPHAFGGTNELGNLVVTCAPCNFGRMSHSLEEVGLEDPRERDPLSTTWDGLERFGAK